MAKRKVDIEKRIFEHRWKAEHLLTEIAEKSVCLICRSSVEVIKEFNLSQHYEAKHQDMLINLNTAQKQQKAEELKKNPTYQQTLFTKAKSQNQAAVKASFIVAEEIAKSSRPFTEGEFLKSCMMKICNILCPEKWQMFANVSISRNSSVDRVYEMATDLRVQMIERSKNFIAYFQAVDGSTNMKDTAQMAILTRGVDSNSFVLEEILDIKLMHGTITGKDIFQNVCQSVTDMKLPWDKLIRLTTDGAPGMCDGKSGLVGRLQAMMQEENCPGELTTYHCIIHQEALCGKVRRMEIVMTTVMQTINVIGAKGLSHRQFHSFLRDRDSEFTDVPYHTDVNWLSRGKILNRVFELSKEICRFMESKEKDSTVLQEEEWKCELAFLADKTTHLNVLNLQLQGRDRMIAGRYDAVKAFQLKIFLWETQLCHYNLPHFPYC